MTPTTRITRGELSVDTPLLYFLLASVYKYVPIRAIAVPNFVWSVSLLPKKSTEAPMMQTRLTTLQTPCETGVTRESVLNANWLYLLAVFLRLYREPAIGQLASIRPEHGVICIL